MIQKGKAWKFGANIDTDVIAPIQALKRDKPEEGYVHCLQDVDPTFAKNCQVGDIFVAEENLGIGSSREWAPHYLRSCGIRLLLAKSFARIFYRNCFNLALPALVCAETHKISAGDQLEVDPIKGEVRNLTKGETYKCDTVPEHLMQIVADGGLLEHLKKKFKKAS
jgi:3-isopropylmalate/(R)-2-methylmalate dehydratase small subunit